MGKIGVGGVDGKKTYCIQRDCQNCSVSNYVHVPKGVKIKDHLLNTVKGNNICTNCGCFVIEFMERV